jgi:hypothetical protein
MTVLATQALPEMDLTVTVRYTKCDDFDVFTGKNPNV